MFTALHANVYSVGIHVEKSLGECKAIIKRSKMSMYKHEPKCKLQLKEPLVNFGNHSPRKLRFSDFHEAQRQRHKASRQTTKLSSLLFHKYITITGQLYIVLILYSQFFDGKKSLISNTTRCRI